MLHAKTAVADSRWARVGSSNLNVASWMGNYELDVAVEDADFAHQMEDSFLSDLENATEIVLSARRRPAPVRRPPPRQRGTLADHGHRRARSGLAAAGALRIGHVVGAAIGGYRVHGPAEAKLLAVGGLALLVVGIVAIAWPRVAAFPIAVMGLWLSLALMWRAWKLRRQAREVSSLGGASPDVPPVSAAAPIEREDAERGALGGGATGEPAARTDAQRHAAGRGTE
jgi:cardiolipin synthase